MDLVLKLLLVELDAANKAAKRAASDAGSGTQEDAARLRNAICRQSSAVLALSNYAARLADGVGGPAALPVTVPVTGTDGPAVLPVTYAVMGADGPANEEPHTVAEWIGLPPGGTLHIDPPRFKLVLYSDGSMEAHRNGEFFSGVTSPKTDDAGGGALEMLNDGVGTPKWAVRFSKCLRAQGHAHPDGTVDTTGGQHVWMDGPTKCSLCGVGWYEAQGTVAPGAMSIAGGSPPDGSPAGRWPVTLRGGGSARMDGVR